MSFILDALRKSDAERQRAAAPGLADVRYATRRSRRNIWLPIVAAVLAANVVFMGVQWFIRPGTQPAATSPPSSPTTSGQPAQPQPAPVPAAEPAPASDIRPLAREAEFGEPELEPASSSPPEPVPATAPTTATETATAPPATPSRILADDGLPTAEQVIGSGTVNIPILNLNLHVYSTNPANRFVIINSHKYKEGGQLTEGPTVETITKDGVILSSQGRRFTLSRR